MRDIVTTKSLHYFRKETKNWPTKLNAFSRTKHLSGVQHVIQNVRWTQNVPVIDVFHSHPERWLRLFTVKNGTLQRQSWFCTGGPFKKRDLKVHWKILICSSSAWQVDSILLDDDCSAICLPSCNKNRELAKIDRVYRWSCVPRMMSPMGVLLHSNGLILNRNRKKRNTSGEKRAKTQDRFSACQWNLKKKSDKKWTTQDHPASRPIGDFYGRGWNLQFVWGLWKPRCYLLNGSWHCCWFIYVFGVLGWGVFCFLALLFLLLMCLFKIPRVIQE